MTQNDSDWTWSNSSKHTAPTTKKIRPFVITASLIIVAIVAALIWYQTVQSQRDSDPTPGKTTYEGQTFGNCLFRNVSGVSTDWITKVEKPVVLFTAECQPDPVPEPRPDNIPHVVSPSGDVHDDCALYLGGSLICNFHP